MHTKLRLLPILILVAGLGAATKGIGIWTEFQSIVGVTEAYAKSSKKEESEDNGEEPKEEHGAEAGDDDDAGHGDDDGESASAEPSPPRPRDTGPQFSRAEVEMLQSLVRRRETLDLRSQELDVRENLLSAAEQRIEEKIAELKTIEATIQDLLERHDEQEEKKLKSLVQIYETMKPKQAARIFEELDIEILIDVAERMNERKIAPILAQMSPQIAKTITVEIRTRKKLPETGGG